MTSLAHQSVEELGGRRSILARQKKDHIRLDEMLDRLPTTTGEQQEELLSRIYRLVFTHAFAEEAVLWPALRRHLEDGEELTTRIEREHQEITELVAELEKADLHDPRRGALLDRTVAMLRQDVRDEEDVLLPRLQDSVDVRTLRRLGRRWELVRRTAPTRTHPVVARRPPGNTLSALPLSVLDRSRDAVEQIGRRAPKPARHVLAAAGAGLAATARKVEHLPPLRTGERSETRVGRSRP